MNNTQNKRIAVCFSGQMRNLKHVFETYYKPNLFDCNPEWDFDIFAHTWFTQEDVGKVYDKAAGGEASNPIPSTVLQELYECYNPKKTLIEKQITFDEKNYAERKARFIIVKFSLSKMYSIKQSSLLRQQYEKENNVKYDMVMLARYDLGLQQKVILDKMPINAYNCSPHGATNDGVDVCFGFMSPDIFDTFALLYDKVDEYWKNGVLFVDEQLAGTHLRKHNIPILRQGFLGKYELVRKCQ